MNGMCCIIQKRDFPHMEGWCRVCGELFPGWVIVKGEEE
jgi:hypothetical protein